MKKLLKKMAKLALGEGAAAVIRETAKVVIRLIFRR